MIFKNLFIFQLTEKFQSDVERLNKEIESGSLKPCGSHEKESFGWVKPYRTATNLVHGSKDYLLVCGKHEERLLPSSVIKDILQHKIIDIELGEARIVGRKERKALEDEIVFDLLPKAFIHSTNIYAYIDLKQQLLIIDTASASKAELLVSHLRYCLGSLPVSPLLTADDPVLVMTDWLKTGEPFGISLNDSCELRDSGEEDGIIRCKHHDLRAEEISNHLDLGKQVYKLDIIWRDRLSCEIDDSLKIKRLKFLDVVMQEANEVVINTEADLFDADFAMMTLELGQFIPELLTHFGGQFIAN